MASLSKLNFALKVTRIQRKSIDKLVVLADSYHETSYERLGASIDTNGDLDIDAFHAVANFQELEFSLYALAIIHCYSILENNRKLILREIPGLSKKQLDNLYKIDTVTDVLTSRKICHEKLRCYKTMEEFRKVNNAIKHSRFGLSRSVACEKKTYGEKQLKSLYLNKVKHLESYLSDLYERICPTHHSIGPARKAALAGEFR